MKKRFITYILLIVIFGNCCTIKNKLSDQNTNELIDVVNKIFESSKTFLVKTNPKSDRKALEVVFKNIVLSDTLLIIRNSKWITNESGITVFSFSTNRPPSSNELVESYNLGYKNENGKIIFEEAIKDYALRLECRRIIKKFFELPIVKLTEFLITDVNHGADKISIEEGGYALQYILLYRNGHKRYAFSVVDLTP